MDSGQVVFLLLTLMICYDLVELYEVQKRFKRAVKSFNNLAQSGLYGIADELNSSRKKAEHYGLWGYVCEERHHEHGPEAPHDNKEVDLHLQQIAQKAFEAKHSHEEWMTEFGNNYL